MLPFLIEFIKTLIETTGQLYQEKVATISWLHVHLEYLKTTLPSLGSMAYVFISDASESM
jgi:hypothetical protein